MLFVSISKIFENISENSVVRNAAVLDWKSLNKLFRASLTGSIVIGSSKFPVVED